MGARGLGVRLGRRVLPGAHAAADAAAEVDTIDLAAIWRDPEIAAAWDAAERRVAPLGLTAQGGMNPGDRRALYYLVRHLRPERVLEVGTLAGASTVHLAVGAGRRVAGAGTPPTPHGRHRRCERSRAGRLARLGLAQSPRQAMERLGFGGMVEFRVAPSLDVLAQPGEPFDLILLDGDHRLETVVAEIPAALGRLRPGGLLLLHDYFPGLRALWADGKVIDGPARAVRRLRRAGWPIRARPLGGLPWPTKYGSTRTSLALLGRG